MNQHLSNKSFFAALKKLIAAVFFSIAVLGGTAQTTRTAGNYSELNAAITASVDNDIISLTNNIVVTAQVTLSKTLTINGNGFYISVPNNGITDAGIINTGASAFRVFEKTDASKTISFNNITIKGGDALGACILITAGNVNFTASIISNGRNSSGGGGGIYNTSGATVRLTNCRLIRNSANYGGGLENGGIIHVESSTFAENRSESASGGGGAVQVNAGAELYINNSTFSNNKSTEIGGAINIFMGTVWVMNSTFSGNVGYGSLTAGGAIGVNSGTAHIINSMFAYNYVRNGGTNTAPTSFALDDVSKYSGTGTINSYYNTFQGSVADHNTTVSNIVYPGLANGSDNTIFSNGILTKITDGTGVEIGTGEVFQPFLVNAAGGIAGTLQPASFALNVLNLGTRTGYGSNASPVAIGYFNGLSWMPLQGVSPQTYEITTDQLGGTRSIPTARGAVEAVVTNVFMFKVNAATGGSVIGGTLYGDIYNAGTTVAVTALPAIGQEFVRWDYVTGGTGVASTSNPYTFTLTQNTTLVPVFQAAAGGNYSITYIGNGNTLGLPPIPLITNLTALIATQGTMLKPGYDFIGWNTNANGSGTPYAANDNYSSGNNLTLYGQWAQSALPLTWLNFSAQPQNDKVLLHWQTANEINVKDFTIQHSADGINWTDAGTVNATGASSQVKNYYFTHLQPAAKQNFYRIIQSDYNGKISVSTVVKIIFAADNSKIAVLNNPVVDGTLRVDLSATQQLSLFTSEGKTVWHSSIAGGKQQINVSQFAKGIYFLSNGASVHKVVIK